MGVEQPQSGPPAQGAPSKTVLGQKEMRHRSRALGQRLRTVLLLVDGRRSHAELRELALRVGASEHCLDELHALGLISLPTPEPVPQPMPEAPAAEQAVLAEAPPQGTPEGASEAPPWMATNPAPDEAVRGPQGGRLTAALYREYFLPSQNDRPGDSGPPTTRSSLVDSVMSTLYPMIESAFGGLGHGEDDVPPQDPQLEEVRRLLLREVRSRAPITGAVTVVKLRRAGTREEMLALLDEVATHISQPMRQLSAQQILSNARTALERPN
jgi:hypothetical protein